MDTHQARTEAIQEEITAKMDSNQERTRAGFNACGKQTTACHEEKRVKAETVAERK
jgi:cytochrome c556